MWSHRIVASSEPDEFVTLIRPVGCKILVTERGSFNGRGILMDIGRLHLQRRREDLARLIQIPALRPGILFLAEPGPSMFLDGAEIRRNDLALFSSGNTYLSRLSGPTSWGTMTLVDDHMESECRWLGGNKAKWIDGCTVITPPPATLARLRSLHAAAGDWAEAPSPAVHPASAYALEQALIRAMFECIDAADVRSDTTALRHNRLIIRRFLEILERHPLKPLNVPKTSRAIGVSGRTLRMACQTHLGVSPTQYLMLRRMSLARRILRQADPYLTRVTDVATDLGFWELGRFSVKYREIFGESPSATLRTASLPRARPVRPDFTPV
jgi:AraC-like DNA-binding protein